MRPCAAMIDYYVRELALPLAVEGVTIPNPDGSFDIYINSLLSAPRREEVLEHELNHILHDHFYIDMPVSVMERQADGEMLNVALHPPAGLITAFHSEDALLNWLRLVLSQRRINLKI